jgi:hypothetical protein
MGMQEEMNTNATQKWDKYPVQNTEHSRDEDHRIK